jgi:hypothetical protein
VWFVSGNFGDHPSHTQNNNVMNEDILPDVNLEAMRCHTSATQYDDEWEGLPCLSGVSGSFLNVTFLTEEPPTQYSVFQYHRKGMIV